MGSTPPSFGLLLILFVRSVFDFRMGAAELEERLPESYRFRSLNFALSGMSSAQETRNAYEPNTMNVINL